MGAIDRSIAPTPIVVTTRELLTVGCTSVHTLSQILQLLYIFKYVLCTYFENSSKSRYGDGGVASLPASFAKGALNWPSTTIKTLLLHPSWRADGYLLVKYCDCVLKSCTIVSLFIIDHHDVESYAFHTQHFHFGRCTLGG